MAEAVFFYVFSLLTVGAALSVVFNRKPIYSVLSLLVVMFCLACLFIMLGAYFVAALQVLLYAGAVLVLFLFVLMLLNLDPDVVARAKLFRMRIVGTAVAVVIFFQLVRLVQTPGGEPPLYAAPMPNGTVEHLGRLLFAKYLLPFELVSFIILAAIVGAVTLSRQDFHNTK